jgi:hypothetical protein
MDLVYKEYQNTRQPSRDRKEGPPRSFGLPISTRFLAVAARLGGGIKPE